MSILTAIDGEKGSDAVLTTAHELANALDKELVVLHVVTEVENRDRERSAVEEIVRDALGETEQTTVRIAEEKSIRDDPSGRRAGRITDEVERVGADYVVVGSRRRSPIGKAMLGSVAQLVLIDSPVPVVVVGQSR